MPKEIIIKTTERNQLIEVTSLITEAVVESKVKDGYCIVYCPHTSAAITITENADPLVKIDVLSHLAKLVPENSNFQHAEGNSDAHVKSALMGNSRIILIENGKLVLGNWEGIFFAEFDGPRTRKAFVKIIKG